LPFVAAACTRRKPLRRYASLVAGEHSALFAESEACHQNCPSPYFERVSLRLHETMGFPE
jgi:hypothetical protein